MAISRTAPATVDRRELLRHRIHAQQLDRESAERALTDAAVLDLGVQDTGRDSASWALANRGVPVASAGELESSDDLALAWTLRGAPHYYRRNELASVLVATSPFSEADAAKRVFDASRPLNVAGIRVLDALAEIARQQRGIVTRPLVKGEVSTLLTQRLSDPYLRECRSCAAVHAYENPFRLSALYAGLELVPGTSPPVLRRIPNWPRRAAGPARDPDTAPPSLQVIRRYLELFGPTSPADVASYLDAPVAVVKSHWPADVDVALDAPAPRDLVRLLGPFDLFLQGRDRDVLVPDAARRKILWPVLGRPGAVLVADDIAGVWRPRAAAGRLTLTVELWRELKPAERNGIGEQAERLATHRGVRLVGVDGLT